MIGLGLLADMRCRGDLIWWLYPIGRLMMIIGAGQQELQNEKTEGAKAPFYLKIILIIFKNSIDK